MVDSKNMYLWKLNNQTNLFLLNTSCFRGWNSVSPSNTCHCLGNWWHDKYFIYESPCNLCYPGLQLLRTRHSMWPPVFGILLNHAPRVPTLTVLSQWPPRALWGSERVQVRGRPVSALLARKSLLLHPVIKGTLWHVMA